MLNKQLTANKASCTPRGATWEGIGLSRARDIDPYRFHGFVVYIYGPLARGPIRIAFYVLAAFKRAVFAFRFRAARNLMPGAHKVSAIEIRASRSAA